MSEKLCDAKPGKQISVFVDNVPGTLAALGGLLGESGINILAMSVAEGLSHGYVRVVVDKHDEAVSLLGDNGYLLFERRVVLLDTRNEPGAFGKVARVWADADINVDYAYCAASPSAESGVIVARVSDVEKAVEGLS